MIVRALMIFSVLLSLAATSSAASFNLPATRDGFVYSFTAASSIASNSFGPPGLLSIGRSDAIGGDVHDLNSLVQFSLASLAGVTSGQVSSASLVLQTSDAAFYSFAHSNAPTVDDPFTVDLYTAAGSWNSATTWTSQPGVLGASQVQQTLTTVSSGPTIVNTTFDVTAIVKNWLNGPGGGGYTNNGFVLKGDAIVGSVDDGYTSALFTARGYTDPNTDPLTFVLQSGGPLLIINTVPEPSSVVLMVLAAAGLVGWRVLRRGRRA